MIKNNLIEDIIDYLFEDEKNIMKSVWKMKITFI